MLTHKALLRLLPFAPFLAQAALDCRPEGPVVPRPTALSEASVFKEAGAKLSDALDKAVSKSINAGWPVDNSSFSLAVVSWDQEDPGTPIWEYHHLSKANKNGTKQLDRDSQYLIGSVSKIFADYVLIKSGIDLDAPVTKFLKTLAKPDSLISWQNITLRMLASNLGGVPTNYGYSEYYFLKDVFVKFGLPPINDSEYPPCGVTALNGQCSNQDILDGMTTLYPTTAPGERPLYTNSAYVILGMVVEEYTGKNFTQLIEEVVSGPLDLKNTFPSPGDDKKAVIPPGESSWGSAYGPNTPAGGLISTTADLSKFAHAFLSRTLDLNPAEIRQWLKPDSFAGGPYAMSGLPWEILRPFDLTPKHPHPITIYGKSGGAFFYRSQFDLVDEYGIAVIILTAGPMKAASILTDAMLTTFVPAVDEISRKQAEQYEVKYKSKKGADVSIEAELSHDKDSVVLSSLRRNGSDIATALPELWNLTMGEFVPSIGAPIRVFPTELTEKSTVDGKSVVGEVWRLWPEISSVAKTDLPGSGLEKKSCLGWMNEDWVRYGGEPLDRVLLYKDNEGKVVGFEIPFLRSGILAPE